MKASEAIKILEGLSPNHEVTLDIGVRARKLKPEDFGPAYAYLPGTPGPLWVDQISFWPKRNEVTCKVH